ncbi:MAG: hypothetical protein KGI89_16635, partial [Euryarchaeota archaeon]|nr:hypothetical protein [Euryarchaeota archaeon]
HDEATFDLSSGRLNILSTVADGHGKVLARQWHSFREYTAEEVLTRVRAVGLEVTSIHASLEPRPRPPGPADSSWQVVARKPRSARPIGRYPRTA